MSLTKNEIKLIKSLQLKKYRDNYQLFVVEGEKMIAELLTQSNFKINTIFHTQDYDHTQISSRFHRVLVTPKELERISGLKTPNKVLATVNMPSASKLDLDETNLILLLDDIKDPGNLGTILRTADWFGITQVIASKKTVDFYNPKTIQSSMGAIYRIHFKQDHLQDTIALLKSNDFIVVGASLQGQNMYKTEFPQKMALVMGSESHGISAEIENQLDQTLLIPKIGATESLNVGVATSIFLAEYTRQVKIVIT